jgi:small subunit ribosomal protein S20
MPIIKSAKKRVRTANKAAVRNSKTKRSLRVSLKSFIKTPSANSHASAVSNIDRALKKGVLHKNKAARLKRQAAAQAKAAGVKNSKPKPATKPAAAKKPATKKAPAKKTASKK